MLPGSAARPPPPGATWGRPLRLLVVWQAALLPLTSCSRDEHFGTLPASPSAVEKYHPGHRAQHVTRLHRCDHSGLEAMLQEEERWHREYSAPAAARRLLAEQRAPPRFVRVSERQARALQEHHRQALVQVAAIGDEDKATPQHHKTIRAHLAYRDQHGIVTETDPAVTGLSSLDSQYVGPIGVGTVLRPEGCTAASGKSLLYVQRAGLGEAPSEASKQCHVEDQSQIWVVFDTGSTNIWVSSDLCKSGPCTKPGRRSYNHLSSSTYADPTNGVMLNIEFGTGRISGPQGIDDFHVGPFTVYNQTFGMIQTQDGRVFEEVPFEGILGLAFPKMSANGVTPFFDNIINQRALQKNEFAFYFSLDNPSANAAFWGGVDPAFHHGEIEYFKVDDPYYWSTDLVSFQIGGQELLGTGHTPSGPIGHSVLQRNTPKAVVDTGTTYFTAESALFEEVMRRLPSVLCGKVTRESHPPILYRLRNTAGELRDFVLTHDQYMTATAPDDDSSVCAPAFMKIDIPAEHGPAMVLGEVFLRHYFSVFDRGGGQPGNARIGFAKAKHGEEVNVHLSELTRNQPAFAGTRTAVVR